MNCKLCRSWRKWSLSSWNVNPLSDLLSQPTLFSFIENMSCVWAPESSVQGGNICWSCIWVIFWMLGVLNSPALVFVIFSWGGLLWLGDQVDSLGYVLSTIQFLLSEPPPISWFYLPNFLSSPLHCKIHSAEMPPVLFSWPVLVQGKTRQGWVFQSFLKLKMPDCWKLIIRETFLLLPTTAAATGSPTALRARAARSYPPSLWAGVPCPQGPCGVTFLPLPVWSVRHGSLPFSNTQNQVFSKLWVERSEFLMGLSGEERYSEGVTRCFCFLCMSC